MYYNLLSLISRLKSGIVESGKVAALSNRSKLLSDQRDFAIFYVGYTTSLLGTAMSRIALTFAVLDSGGTAADLGYVFAASVFPQVLVMLAGGVIADRVGRRRVMLVADVARLTVQGTLAGALFAGQPRLWFFLLLSALLASAEGVFNPALGGLQVELVPPVRRQDANALIGVAQSATAIAGPALAGLLIAVSGPGVVIAIDAASYGASVVALALLTLPQAGQRAQSAWLDFTESLAVFRSQTWLYLITAQFALFNLFTWAPYLLLGPLLARSYLGGAWAWGVISAAFAAGAVLAGLGLVGRRPRRPLVWATAGTFGYPVPCLLLALHAPVYAVAAGALLAGVGSAVSNTFATSVRQQQIPPQMQARINAIMLTGSYALGSAGWAVIGPLAVVVGPTSLLAFAAAYGAASSVAVLVSPAIRSIRWQSA
jgi:MFS family permease